MRRRGRPPHPDVLTPREQEVLELLREGLTNAEIAERLSTSPDGAKYHVAEILSKLAVSSREEAARWSPKERPWWAGAVAPLGIVWRRAGWVIGGAALVAAVAGLALLGLLLLRSSGNDRLVGPASQERDVWDRVVALTSANVSPILRPTLLPEGFKTVTLVAPNDPNGYFMVEYAGSQKRLRVAVGKLNPALPGPPGHQEQVRIRNLDCVTSVKGTACPYLQTQDDAQPRGSMFLAWHEPGRWRSEPGSPVQDIIEYWLFSEGLTSQELIDVAEGMVLANP